MFKVCQPCIVGGALAGGRRYADYEYLVCPLTVSCMFKVRPSCIRRLGQERKRGGGSGF
jgi:hypothetical protein